MTAPVSSLPGAPMVAPGPGKELKGDAAQADGSFASLLLALASSGQTIAPILAEAPLTENSGSTDLPLLQGEMLVMPAEVAVVEAPAQQVSESASLPTPQAPLPDLLAEVAGQGGVEPMGAGVDHPLADLTVQPVGQPVGQPAGELTGELTGEPVAAVNPGVELGAAAVGVSEPDLVSVVQITREPAPTQSVTAVPEEAGSPQAQAEPPPLEVAPPAGTGSQEETLDSDPQAPEQQTDGARAPSGSGPTSATQSLSTPQFGVAAAGDQPVIQTAHSASQASGLERLTGRYEPQQLVDELAQAVSTAEDGDYSVTLKLHPEHLGEVRLQLQLSGRAVYAAMEVASTEARQLLENRSDHLRQSLDQAGFSLSGFEVSTGQRRQPRDQSERFAQQQRGSTGPIDPVGPQRTAAINRIRHAGPRGGRLDTMA